MGRAGRIFKWALPPCALLAALWASLAIQSAADEANPFFTTSSPAGTYTLNLTGRKDRPFITPNTVNYHVLKAGESFLPSTHLHTAHDFMDLSFEIGYPHHRWIGDNVVQLYNGQHLSDGEPDALVVVNGTGQIIKHLKVSSGAHFLCFDVQPGAEITLPESRPRGDFKVLHVTGELYGGRRIEGGAALVPNRQPGGPHTYYAHINADGATFRGPE